MKKLIPLFLLAGSLLANPIPPLENAFVEKMAEAIYKSEGGDKAKSPYGVLSIKVRDKEHAKQIVFNSIRNNWKRWHQAGKPNDFVSFMADRWCPPSADPVGNRNWKKNVKYFLDK